MIGGFVLNSLDDRYSHETMAGNNWSEIIKGNVVSGSFNSKFQNLGIVGIRFDNLDRINNDEIEFRIKESNHETWDYSSIYKTDQFQKDRIFPFGFPTVTNSKDIQYYYEIESMRGATGSAVKISTKQPTVIVRSVFTKKMLLSDVRLMFYFVTNKIINIFGDVEFSHNFIVYSLPLFIYLVSEYLGQSLLFPFTTTLLLLLVDVFWMRTFIGFMQISIIYSWMILIKKHKVGAKVSSVFSALILIMVILLAFLEKINQSDKAAFWVYVFLGISIVSQYTGLITKTSVEISSKHFWNSYFIQLKHSFMFIYLIAKGDIIVSTRKIEANITGNEKSARAIALMISRLGGPVVKTYLLSSRVIAYVIIGFVRLIKIVYKYGPYAISLWLVYWLYKQIIGYFNFYLDYFMDNQVDIFWNSAGKYFVLVGVFSLLSFFLLQRKKDMRTKSFIAIIILIISFKINQGIFNTVTPYRDNVKIWRINPQETGEPWVDVTVRGRNFGEMPFKGKVFIGGIEQRVVSWSRKEIVFRTNPLFTKTGFVTIKTAQGKESDTYYFTYTGNR